MFRRVLKAHCCVVVFIKMKKRERLYEERLKSAPRSFELKLHAVSSIFRSELAKGFSQSMREQIKVLRSALGMKTRGKQLVRDDCIL